MKEIVLEPAGQFEPVPAEAEVEGRPCYVLKDGEQYRLVSRRCPHAGQMVEWEDGELVCPMHGWTFNQHTGACLTIPAKRLAEYRIAERDGKLVVQLED
ncbi:Rieske (2Fe-2S) protein [Paenibacillus sp. TAB 01]|uniref:Rieske (2Fe-2S) protein n=1 Tax=Paenibacillus sp. TAB 01 TaxID=3368988 RepID=UPI003751E6F0